MTYGTTVTFLDYFGLRSLDELPELQQASELSMQATELGIEKTPGSVSDSNTITSETKNNSEPSSD